MPVDRTTAFPYEPSGDPGPFVYARFDHPTGVDAEAALGDLEGGRALLFSSGAAACAAVVYALAGPGQTIAVAEGSYYGTSVLFSWLERWGLRHVAFDQTGAPPAGADVVWLEAPSNPYLTFPDLEGAAAHGGLVVVDATASSPVLFRPLEHGADVVVHSATKYLGGHHDVLLGSVAVRSDARFDALKATRTITGAVAAPDTAWLLLRSLKTLRLRVEHQSASALELARRLDAHPSVQAVRYPGLGPDPRAARYMRGGFGGLLSFDVADGAAARTVETSLERIANATSLGAVDSSLESRHRHEGDRVPPGLLRLSVGLEPVEELWADLERALGRI